MRLSIATAVCFLTISALGAPEGRIVGGVDAEAGDVPYIISLRAYGRHDCGGSIISEDYILTAAHCVMGSVKEKSIQFGRLNVSSQVDSSVIDVEEAIVHEEYDSSTIRNDIALLKLKQKIQIGGIAGIAQLPAQDEALPGETPVLLAGWGRLSFQVPYNYKKSTLVVDVEQCKKMHTHEVYDSNVCAGVPEGGKGQCNGDAGGPQDLNGKVVGVVSWSVKPCAVKGYPAVFTRVARATETGLRRTLV